jgi:hypothetical protein
MQIAGENCKICGCQIVFSNEGKYCSCCSIVVHISCESRDECATCHQQFQIYEPPKFEVMRDALLPAGLRSGNNSGQKMALILTAVFALLVIVIFYLFTYDFNHMHDSL